MPDVTELLVLVAIVAIAVIYLLYAFVVIRSKPATGAESMLGAKGTVYSESLNDGGEVVVGGVIWKAHLVDSRSRPLKKGDRVIVDRVEDITLVVEPDSTQS